MGSVIIQKFGFYERNGSLRICFRIQPSTTSLKIFLGVESRTIYTIALDAETTSWAAVEQFTVIKKLFSVEVYLYMETKVLTALDFKELYFSCADNFNTSLQNFLPGMVTCWKLFDYLQPNLGSSMQGSLFSGHINFINLCAFGIVIRVFIDPSIQECNPWSMITLWCCKCEVLCIFPKKNYCMYL